MPATLMPTIEWLMQSQTAIPFRVTKSQSTDGVENAPCVTINWPSDIPNKSIAK
jgi:hypothetical protein